MNITGVKFNRVQEAAVSLIRQDLRFIYTIIINQSKISPNYVLSFLPYLGIIIDGAEDWVNRFNASSRQSLDIPTFTDVERVHYEAMRSSSKLWESPYDDIYRELGKEYQKSERYFRALCNPLARVLKLYDLFGVDIVDGNVVGNTILCSYYYPSFTYEMDGAEISQLFEVSGRYISMFRATQNYKTDTSMQFSTKDYGGIIKSPIGNSYSDRFIMFSLLCQIQFILYCVNKWVVEDTPSKLRFTYVLYYYAVNIVEKLNQRCHTGFTVQRDYFSERFRNAMMHYGLGVEMIEDDLIIDDPMFGLTQKILNIDYLVIKDYLIYYLNILSQQLKNYLKI